MLDTWLQRLVLDGGPMMWVLIPCSFLTLGAILQAGLRLRRGRLLPSGILEQAQLSTTECDSETLILALRTHSSTLGRAVWHTFKSFDLKRGLPEGRELQLAIEESSATAADELHEKLGLLGTLYTVAPLLGIMGTVMGMMQTFYEFAVRDEKSIKVLSIGIQQALITTLWGLGIAIVAYVAAAHFQNRITHIEHYDLPDRLTKIAEALSAPTNNETQGEA